MKMLKARMEEENLSSSVNCLGHNFTFTTFLKALRHKFCAFFNMNLDKEIEKSKLLEGLVSVKCKIFRTGQTKGLID